MAHRRQSPGSGLRPYRWLARYYDRVMVDHAALFRGVRRTLLRNILPKVTAVCDLACGSGETALDFARYGYQVYAVDLSPTQVRTVRRKAREQKLPVKVVRGDMRTFRLPEPVDLVTCEFDALNHVPHHSDLHRVMRSVARALRPGGWFYFDINTRKAFETLWATQTWIDAEEFKVAIHGRFDDRTRRAELHLEWFLPAGRKRFRHRRETIHEVCWDPGEVRSALRTAGFGAVRPRDGAPFFGGWDWDAPGCRTFYLAQKEVP